jgi:DNA polymerase
LLVGDFSGIESRVLAWIAGEQSKIDSWAQFDRTGNPHDDPYYLTGKRCGLSDDIARDKGKIIDLAFGYQGALGAWRNLAAEGDATSDVDIQRYKETWRSAHPQTVAFWAQVERHAIAAIRRPGTAFTYKRLSFSYDGACLTIRLPSGRSISYPFPRLETGRFGHPVVMFKDNAAGKLVDCGHGHGFYGGAFTENIVWALRATCWPRRWFGSKSPAMALCSMFTTRLFAKCRMGSAISMSSSA